MYILREVIGGWRVSMPIPKIVTGDRGNTSVISIALKQRRAKPKEISFGDAVVFKHDRFLCVEEYLMQS
jgi:hypothetical protein